MLDRQQFMCSYLHIISFKFLKVLKPSILGSEADIRYVEHLGRRAKFALSLVFLGR